MRTREPHVYTSDVVSRPINFEPDLGGEDDGVEDVVVVAVD
eukprot:COSAG01_NODE_60204_length_296_cov_0.527919_2_plen_40_part_01